MKTKKKPIEQFIDNQVKIWKTKTEGHIPVITISTEPGSGGHVIAQRVSHQLGIALFDRDIVKEIAESARISDTVIASMEKERLTGVEDFIASLVDDHYLYPGVYTEHLMRVVSAIASHGSAVIVGRGANFIIPPEECLRVRVVAPLKSRVANVVKKHGVSDQEAKRRVLNRENKRRAFIRQSFNADASDPDNYDLVINTGQMPIDGGVGAIIGSVIGTKDVNVPKSTGDKLRKWLG